MRHKYGAASVKVDCIWSRPLPVKATPQDLLHDPFLPAIFHLALHLVLLFEQQLLFQIRIIDCFHCKLRIPDLASARTLGFNKDRVIIIIDLQYDGLSPKMFVCTRAPVDATRATSARALTRSNGVKPL